jgi:CheY-like chemotaxis protein/HPt (histidine-containing phosphotransfer) domain-containing protein
VEDNYVNQKLAMLLLQKAGYAVDVIENGQQAYEQTRLGFYDAVLMDVQMPVMDGFQATQLIREWETGKGRHIPIIAMTAAAMKGDRERCLEAGMDGYLSKPLDAQALIETLDRWMVYSNKSTETIPQPVIEEAATTSIDINRSDVHDKRESQVVVPPFSPEPVPDGQLAAEPLDIKAAMPRFLGDKKFFLEMCQEFVKNLPARVAEMKAALDAGDARALFFSAHKLKGVSANFDANLLTMLCGQLETMSNQGDLSQAPTLVTQIQFEVMRVMGFLMALDIKSI